MTLALLLVPMLFAAGLILWVVSQPTSDLSTDEQERLPPSRRPLPDPFPHPEDGPMAIDPSDLAPFDESPEAAPGPVARPMLAMARAPAPTRAAPALPPGLGARTPSFMRSAEEFAARFATEEDCVAHLVAARFPGGFSCPVCHTPETRPSGSPTVLCCRTGHRTSLVAGTVMERSTVPLPLWFRAAHLLVCERPEATAMELRRMLDLDRHDLPLLLLSRLRSRLAGVDGAILSGDVEVGIVQVNLGDGSLYEVGVAIEVQDETDAAGGPRRVPARLHVQGVDMASQEEVDQFLLHAIAPGSRVYTFDGPLWSNVSTLGFQHLPELEPPMPRLSEVAGAIQAFLADTQRGALTRLHIGAELTTFAWRFNRSGSRWLAFHWALGLPAAPPAVAAEAGQAARPKVREAPHLRAFDH